MCKRHFTFVACLTLALAGCQSSGSGSSASKQGYFTWVDDQGQVRQTPIPETPSEDDKDQDTDGDGAPEPAGDDQDAEGGSEAYDAEFNIKNYPDGDQLEKDGYVRPGEPQPYFTWTDAEGNVRASYYQPDTRSAVEKGRIQPPIELTEASVYQATEEAEDVNLPEDADPAALAVLGVEPGVGTFFEQWSEQCCESLERSESEAWQEGRAFGVDIDESAPVHTFESGRSRYRLVKLPPADERSDFILHIRSFAKDGVFVPSVTFLDGAFEPLRIVTDLVADYVPEAWHRHGYLQAYIPVFPARGERWMLIFTRDEDLDQQTVIEGKYGPEAIPHTRTGELGLSREGD